MFTCIACTKPAAEEGEEGARGSGTPSTKEAVKSLTAQIKDMALKISGKQCKTGAGTSSGYRKGETGYPDFDVNSPYFGAASSSSTPAWDFTSSHHRPGANSRGDSRFTRVLAAGDQTPSADDVLLDDDPNKEWMAQVEPGVHITFVSLPNGGNDLKRIRFSREMFNKWQAQRWWGENYDRIMELYNVQRFNRQSLNTPPRSEDEVQRDSTYSRLGSARESPMIPSHTPRNYYRPSGMEANSYEASRTTSSSRDERPSVCASTASHMESEWVEQDEPGVYITIRQLNDGTRELRRVRFSRERFGEVNAKTWWEENRERIQAQYL